MVSITGMLDTIGFQGSWVNERMDQSGQTTDFQTVYKGSFTSTLRWHQLDALWERVRARPEGWYVYAVGATPPENHASEAELTHFLLEIDGLLRTEHDEKYCGIVYADDLEHPTMIKIYDPHNLGVTCGYSDNPPPPGWVLSRIQPVDLMTTDIMPRNRKHWWQRIFSN